ncbi:MAG: M48 family metalloprotease [Rhodobacteraceae bacterium]|nr:M48 family metalloprotease [Paracoccaceae bacterium]
MPNPQVTNDRFIIITLAVWLFSYSLFNLPLIIFSAFVVITIILIVFSGLYWARKERVRDALSSTKYDEADFRKIDFRLIGNSDYSERSGLFSRVVGVPGNYDQYRTISPRFHEARLLHEIGHTLYRDNLVMTAYFAIAVWSIVASIDFAENYMGKFTAFDYSNLEWMTVNIPERLKIYVVRSFTGPILVRIVEFAVVISFISMIYFLRHREYRADAYAFTIAGQEYEEFIQHQVIKEKITKTNGLLTGLWNFLTHPSFKTRQKHLKSSNYSYIFVVLVGLLWGVLMLFCAPIIVSLYGFLSADDGSLMQLTATRTLTANSMADYGVIHKNSAYVVSAIWTIYLALVPYFMSTFIKDLVSSQGGFLKSIIFVLSILLPVWAIILLGKFIQFGLGASEFSSLLDVKLYLAIALWVTLQVGFHYYTLSSSNKSDLRALRFIWPAVTIYFVYIFLIRDPIERSPYSIYILYLTSCLLLTAFVVDNYKGVFSFIVKMFRKPLFNSEASHNIRRTPERALFLSILLVMLLGAGVELTTADMEKSTNSVLMQKAEADLKNWNTKNYLSDLNTKLREQEEYSIYSSLLPEKKWSIQIDRRNNSALDYVTVDGKRASVTDFRPIHRRLTKEEKISADTLIKSINSSIQAQEFDDLHDRALSLYRIHGVTYGEEHPAATLSLIYLGLSEFYLGKYKGAIPFFETALFILENTLGTEHPSTGDIYSLLANTEVRAYGSVEKSLSSMDRARHIYSVNFGDEYWGAVAAEKFLQKYPDSTGGIPVMGGVTIEREDLGDDGDRAIAILRNSSTPEKK